MAADESEVRTAAQHVWPNAKTIRVQPGGHGRHASIVESDLPGWQVVAFDYDDKIISQASAESLELLKGKLDGMLPQGGQAP